MKLWAMFSVEDDYYQPRNNLQLLYEQKPSFEMLVWFLYGNREIAELEEHELIDVVNLLQLKEVDVYGTFYRLEEITVGEQINQADD